MKITGVKLSILESSIEDRIFGLHNVPGMTRIRWTHNVARTRPGYVEVLHVQTDEGIEGVCSAQGVAGDAAASPLKDALEQLRISFDRPIHLSSAYRCPDYNDEVSSTGRNGPHTRGAFDVLVSGTDAYDLLLLAIIFEWTGIGISQKGPHD